MRELTYYVACSVDGFIAHSDGSLDGFSEDRDYITALAEDFPETFPAQYRELLGITAANQHFDTVLMGRNTYEIGVKVGMDNPYPHLKQYLFSRRLKQSPVESVKLVSGDAIAAIKQLKETPGKGIWLCGGSTLAKALFAENLIDCLILKINPFLMGSGIPLFSDVINQTPLTLTDHQTYSNGVYRVHYQVIYD